MHSLATIREFNTRHFRVIVDAVEEHDLDLSWDETGETREQLERGLLVAFCARVRVIHKPTGAILGTDYLGNCIYKRVEDFQDHRECGKQTREHEARGEKVVVGSYFACMIAEAIKEARVNIESICKSRRRKSA